MSPPDNEADNGFPVAPENAARIFATAGLSASSLSPEKLAAAIRSAQPLRWKMRRQASDSTSDLLRRVAQGMVSGNNVRVPGLRLIIPMMWGRLARSTAERIGEIVKDPGYHAVAQSLARDSGVASFVFDDSIVPDWHTRAALRWPLNVVAEGDDLFDALRDASAVQRGFVRLWTRSVPPNVATPYVDAQVVEWADENLGGKALALRFIDSGPLPPAFPHPLRLRDIQGVGTSVFLPTSGMDLAIPVNAPRVLSDFVNEVAHNLPVDVAAWEAARYRGGSTGPLVFAPNGFLRRSRLSDTLPLLQSRLRKLRPDVRLPLIPGDLEGFGPSFSKRMAQSSLTVADIASFLNDPKTLDWNYETKSGEALITLERATGEMESYFNQRGSRRGEAAAAAPPLPPPPEDAAPKSEPGISYYERSASAARDAATEESTYVSDYARVRVVVDAAAASLEAAAPPPPPPPRYTDVRILDADEQPHDITQSFIANRKYSLDVAIRAQRIGLTRDDETQKPPKVKQTQTVTIWAVITDESDGRASFAHSDRDGAGAAPGRDIRFRFKTHFGRITLPVSGDSSDSAVFVFEPDCATSCTGRIGIRLYHNLSLIDHLQLDMNLVADEADVAVTHAQPAVHVTQKEPESEAIEPLDPRSEARVLTISVSRESADLWRFALVAGRKDAPGVPWLSATKTLSESLLNSSITKFRDILLKAAFNEALYQLQLDSVARDKLLKSFGSLGTQLVTDLFDYSSGGDFFELSQILREAIANVAIVQVVLGREAKSFVFPWQILPIDPAGEETDPNNLWGYRFAIEIRRWGDGTSRPANADLEQPRATYARWHFDNEAQHFAEVEKILTAASIPLNLPIVDSYADFKAALFNAVSSMFYVYAHGHASTPASPSAEQYRTHARQELSDLERLLEANPAIAPAPEVAASRKQMLDQYLSLTDDNTTTVLLLKKGPVQLTKLLVEAATQNWRFQNAPIVFLNTCESAQIWNSAESSFVGFFLDRGARAVVGTESTIPMVMADVFGRKVIEALVQRKTLGDAVQIARLHLLQSCSNPLGLCYSIYGTADAGLLPRITTQ